jgi:hypothetical protein
MSEKVACPECGEKYENLGQHWRYNPSHRPSFTQHQEEVITGLIMGDGYIDTHNKNPLIKCGMISQNYLEYIDSVFGCLGTGVSLQITAKESAKKSRDRGFSPNAKAENYSDLYRWTSRTHPELEEWANWYSTGKKIWPEDIELTPVVLKHWYCGDGCWRNTDSKNYISIAMSNEIENQDKVTQIFENVGLPAPSNYNISERKDGSKKCNAEWTVEQSKELWEYMGEPLPDFEYKWPEQYH